MTRWGPKLAAALYIEERWFLTYSFFFFGLTNLFIFFYIFISKLIPLLFLFSILDGCRSNLKKFLYGDETYGILNLFFFLFFFFFWLFFVKNVCWNISFCVFVFGFKNASSKESEEKLSCSRSEKLISLRAQQMAPKKIWKVLLFLSFFFFFFFFFFFYQLTHFNILLFLMKIFKV